MNTTESPTELAAVPGSGLGVHTPGPWRWISGEDANNKYGRSDLSRLVGPLYDTTCDRTWDRKQEICFFGNDETYYPTEGTEPSDADKLLIAAAPDLLAACLRVLNPTDEGPKMADIVSAAVAKALGQNTEALPTPAQKSTTH